MCDRSSESAFHLRFICVSTAFHLRFNIRLTFCSSVWMRCCHCRGLEGCFTPALLLGKGSRPVMVVGSKSMVGARSFWSSTFLLAHNLVNPCGSLGLASRLARSLANSEPQPSSVREAADQDALGSISIPQTHWLTPRQAGHIVARLSVVAVLFRKHRADQDVAGWHYV